MAQNLPRFCPRCGTPIVAGQHFCPNCGLTLEVRQTGERPATVMQDNGQDTTRPLPGGRQTLQNAAYPAPDALQEAGPFQARSFGPSPKTRGPGKVGTRLLVLLLLLLIILGAASYFAFAALGNNNPTTQPPITTLPINATIPYAGVAITVLNAQQSQSFLDDPNTGTDGMVRLHLQEQNKTNLTIRWLYYDIARLLLPGNKSVPPTYVKATVGIAPGATQTSMLDFAVPTDLKISQLTLRLGTSTEAQMDIPLTSHANLSAYQPKTTKLNAQLLYLGLNWTLTSVTSTLSIDGQQASRGMRYFIVTLSVDNALSQTVIVGSAYDFVRLKSSSTTATPQNSTLPVSFATGVTGQTGTVAFLLPQNSTVFTLILLPQSHSGVDQATTDFHLA